METITNFLNGIDNNLGSILDNRYLFVSLVVLTILFGSLAHSRLTSIILSLFDTTISRLFLLGSLYYISTKNVSLAILMLTATVITMNTQNKFRFNYLLMTLFRRSHSPRFMSQRGTPRSFYFRSPRSSVRSLNDMMRSSEKAKQLKLRKLRQIYLNQILNQLVKAVKKAGSKKRKLPKKIKKAAKKAKKIARSIGQATPKIVKQIVKSTPKIADPKLVPSVVVDRLLGQKKISSDEASKLRSIKTSSILELLKSREINSLTSSEKSKSTTPQISISSPASTPKTLTPKTLTPKTESTITTSVVSTPKTQIIFPKQTSAKSEKFNNYLDKYFNI
jgi:hypothetical protein